MLFIMNDRKISFRKAINEALEEELSANPNLIIIGEDIIDADRQPTTDNLDGKFPGRVINHLPLAEDMLCGMGLGMYLGGLKPIIQFDCGTFLTLALNDIWRLGTWRYRMAEKEGPGVVIRLGHNGYFGCGAEFATSLLSLAFHLPNILIATPSFAYHAKGLLKSALRANRPVIFVENKHPLILEREGWVPEEEYMVSFGTSAMPRTGKDITIISWLFGTFDAILAADALQNDGIGAEVISLQTIYPMDINTILASAKKTGKVVIVEEDMLRGGVGAEISARINESLPLCRTLRVAAKNIPLPCGTQRFERLILPDKDAIITASHRLMNI